MHVDIVETLRLVVALGFAVCVVGFFWAINQLRRDMTGDGQRARYAALLFGVFAGAAGNAEQLRLHTPLGFRIYTTTAFLITSLAALVLTLREVRAKVKRDENARPAGRRKR